MGTAVFRNLVDCQDNPGRGLQWIGAIGHRRGAGVVSRTVDGDVQLADSGNCLHQANPAAVFLQNSSLFDVDLEHGPDITGFEFAGVVDLDSGIRHGSRK